MKIQIKIDLSIGIHRMLTIYKFVSLSCLLLYIQLKLLKQYTKKMENKPKGEENQYHATDADGNMPTVVDGINMAGIMPGAGQK